MTTAPTPEATLKRFDLAGDDPNGGIVSPLYWAAVDETDGKAVVVGYGRTVDEARDNAEETLGGSHRHHEICIQEITEMEYAALEAGDVTAIGGVK